MGKGIYHSALKGSIVYDVSGTAFYEGKNFSVFQYDLIAEKIPSRGLKADCVYAEPPYPSGFAVFNERAGASGARTYDDLAGAISKIIESGQPTYITLGKTLLKKLPEPKGTIEVMLNGLGSEVAYWGTDIRPVGRTTKDVVVDLARRYGSMWDFCCGYGDCLVNFMASGGEYAVGSDYDNKCVTITKGRLQNVD
ncbi:MAG: hypothetical protein CMI54_02340 [Parcubacteria group bacterium]|nr:hypothetical protein [Parcubacteria group bacterium]|tara:strand:- start:3541 stop:4125 length:585 start_codon:yes stop_codon:yes gene_type:complete